MRRGSRRADDREEVGQLRNRVRSLTAERDRAFDQGFRAAIAMLEGGATIDRLKEAADAPRLTDSEARERGLVVTSPEDDTLPNRLLDPERD